MSNQIVKTRLESAETHLRQAERSDADKTKLWHIERSVDELHGAIRQTLEDQPPKQKPFLVRFLDSLWFPFTST